MQIVTRAKALIVRIDRDIDAIRRQMKKLEDIDPMSAESWQAAWDRRPSLRARRDELFRRRGHMQVVRDRAMNESALQKIRAARPVRAKRCPTCGHSYYSHAA